MIIAFQIILIFIILISFICSVGEKEDKNLRNNCLALCIAAIGAFVATVILL